MLGCPRYSTWKFCLPLWEIPVSILGTNWSGLSIGSPAASHLLTSSWLFWFRIGAHFNTHSYLPYIEFIQDFMKEFWRKNEKKRKIFEEEMEKKWKIFEQKMENFWTKKGKKGGKFLKKKWKFVKKKSGNLWKKKWKFVKKRGKKLPKPTRSNVIIIFFIRDFLTFKNIY